MKFMDAGPYPVEIGFCICPKDWAREMRKRGTSEPFPDHAGHAALFNGANGASFMIVSFSAEFRTHTHVERIGVAVHEATHVWQFIKEHLRESAAGHEVEACSIQWITQWLLEQLQAVGWLKR
jgi:hypothetical protein